MREKRSKAEATRIVGILSIIDIVSLSKGRVWAVKERDRGRDGVGKRESNGG
jgi:hypothetical protein